MTKNKVYIVDLKGDKTCFIADWPGDPGRTCIIESAKKYENISSATFSLAHARKFRDFKNAEIISIEEAKK